MKLIKINTDHYVIVDDSEIKERDYSFYPPFGIGINIVIDEELCFYVKSKDGKGSFTQRTYQTLDRNKKITHSTNIDWNEVYYIPLSEVKELIGEVDVEKMAKKDAIEVFGNDFSLASLAHQTQFKRGYYQALEDNKGKKYTEEIFDTAIQVVGSDKVTTIRDFLLEHIQPKTEWEVEYDENGKLKLV